MNSTYILIDAREFVLQKKTGIGRFLEGLIDALTQAFSDVEITLATHYKSAVPHKLRDKRRLIVREIPPGFISSEKTLSDLA